MEKKITIKNLVGLSDFAKSFLAEINEVSQKNNKATIVALSGDLGAGKTTFVKSLAAELGVMEVVTSPTFTIMKGYETGVGQKFKSLIHIDAYRIDDLEELRPLRLAEILLKNEALVCIEWAEKIAPALPLEIIKMNFESLSDDCREVTYKI